jgi:nitronate monooxygenase
MCRALWVCCRCWLRRDGSCCWLCLRRAGSATRRRHVPRAAGGAMVVVMGTRFVASDECGAHPRYEARLLGAQARNTVLTELFDVGSPASPHRVIRNSTYQHWEAVGCPQSGERPGEGEAVAGGIQRYESNPPLASTKGDIEAMAMYARQSVGSITAVESAAAIVERFAVALRNP